VKRFFSSRCNHINDQISHSFFFDFITVDVMETEHRICSILHRMRGSCVSIDHVELRGCHGKKMFETKLRLLSHNYAFQRIRVLLFDGRLGVRSTAIDVARGDKGPLNFYRILSFCALRSGVPNQISCSLDCKIIGPPNVLGWLRYCPRPLSKSP